MKINAIPLSHLRNNGHSDFMHVVKDLLNDHATVLLVVTTLFAEFTALYIIEETLVNSHKGSDYTRLLADADNDLDRILVGINSLVIAGLHNSDASIREAAHRIQIRLNDFGNIESMPYKEEANAVRQLAADLINDFAVDIITLALTLWVEDLTASSANFDLLFKQRNAEYANRPTEKLKAIRHRIDAVYRSMIERINAAELMDETGAFEEFSRELNKAIQYAVDHAFHHARKDITHVNANTIADQLANGKAITPIPILIYIEEGKKPVELVFAVDFTVTYRNNVNVGTATIILHGKGLYKGQKIITFNIVEA